MTAPLRPAILATRRLPAPVEDRLRRDYRADLNAEDALYDRATFLAKAAKADGILCTLSDRLTADLLADLPPRVNILATFSVGTDHIDVAAARARGLVVTNTPGALTEATADIALLLLLGAARRAHEGQTLLRSGGWRGWAPTQLMGVELHGKRLGIAGMGRIGQATARRARACGMEIHYWGRRARELGPDLPARFHADDRDFLRHCDALSIHMASAAETRRWLNAARIACLPPGAIVVNTARGDLVDDDALIAALQDGRLAAAGLDVFAGEPDLDRRYLVLPNAMLLPHLGSATFETRCAMGFRALDNLDAFFAGRSPPDPVI